MLSALLWVAGGGADTTPRHVLPGTSAAVAPPAAVQVLIEEVAAGVRARLDEPIDILPGGLTDAERADLSALYREAYAPLWVDADGRPTRSARDARAVLERAAVEGLDLADYAFTRLRHLAEAIERAAEPPAAALAGFDVTLSAAMLRYLRHLHEGRVDPRTLGFRLTAAAERHDFVMWLRAALRDRRIAETAADLRPQLVQYGLLREALARYRALAADAGVEPLPPLSTPVRPGEPYAGLGALYRHLVLLGDLPPDTPLPNAESAYEGAIVQGVRRFQERHGLEPDGIIGRATHTALLVPLAWRVRQIELALERLRWLPDLDEGRFLALNIPMFHLWGWESGPEQESSIGMRAMVGRAFRTPTPVLVEEMRYVVFRPYWNVPPSILRNEILPILARDPDYLRREQMEIVRGWGDDAPVVEASLENLALLRQGVLRLRQQPGPHNALGLVKFVFPNDEHVYLHGTPAQELFARARRDFSHGCVRVEDPLSLAEWILRDRPEWTRDRIQVAMHGPRPSQVTLRRPVQVLLFYTTAVVMPEDGTVRFAEDIYGHDARLDRALSPRRQEG